uniref:Inorganic pyrophosphatase n=1 Tax=Lygus hesperus TaxID=30085 RepID=A0A0A9Z4K2_LYGHE
MNDEASSPSADWGNHTIADLRQPVTKALRPGTRVRCRSRDFVSNWAKAKAETSEILKLSAEKNDADVHSRKLAILDMKKEHDKKLQDMELLNAQQMLQNLREMREKREKNSWRLNY